jgi:gliding motility-associated protein GldM
MAHGKETPRQKMIGMMYLVLTALLALNVQKEVLNAFINVDEGLNKAVENYLLKNKQIYDEFYQKAEVNPAKVGKYKTLVDTIRIAADNLYNKIFDLKKQIIQKTEKSDSAPAIDYVNKVIYVEKMTNKDNMDIPAEVMIGDNNNGAAYPLKKEIEAFRELLIKHVNPKHTAIIASINKSLDTSDPPAKEGNKETWETKNFEHLPVAGVMAIMTGLQNDIKTAEHEIIKYLDEQIEAKSFKFNMLRPTIIPNTNYVFRGNEYSAQIFLAAYDTTQKPDVFIGDYDSTVTEDGYELTMRGREGIDYVRCNINEQGTGIFKRTESTTGIKTYKGIIRIKNPDGSFITRSFRNTYTVAEPSLVISPTKMNVFYVAVDNPVRISIPGVPDNKIFPTLSGGTGQIVKEGNEYVVKPTKAGEAIISVIAEIDGQKKPMGSMKFRVKTVPNPEPKLGGKSEGTIDKGLLNALDGIYAEMPAWFDFDLKFNITGFKIVYTDNGGFTQEKESKSGNFTTEQKNMLSKFTRNQRFYIEEITAVGPDGTTRKLPTMSFRVN